MVFVGKKIHSIKCFDTNMPLRCNYQVVTQDQDCFYIQESARLHTASIFRVPLTNRTFYFDDSIYQWDDQSETLQEIADCSCCDNLENDQDGYFCSLIPPAAPVNGKCEHFIINKDIMEV